MHGYKRINFTVLSIKILKGKNAAFHIEKPPRFAVWQSGAGLFLYC
jgi:hypothetical protein